MKYYTGAQAAKKLNVHPNTISKYIQNGDLKAKKIGSKLQISAIEIAKIEEQRKGKSKGDKKDAHYYTRAEAAKKLGVHPHTISKFVRNNELKAVGMGKELRIPKNELVNYKTKNCEHSPYQQTTPAPKKDIKLPAKVEKATNVENLTTAQLKIANTQEEIAKTQMQMIYAMQEIIQMLR